MLRVIAEVVSGAAIPAVTAALMRRQPGYHFWFGWTGGALAAALIWAAFRIWPETAGSALSSLVAAICWWLSRRKRKRSAKLIGEKSRVLLAAMVARMRETAKPRQVLRPVPGGSGA